MKINYTDEQLKAAYALNLCTVSISQIIDYNDINIMEQEYEGILNNLNLEQMPKDEALLKILKQILDTITFFRIEDGDKKMIEKEYQHKIKNAIWSAVPNIGMFVGATPLTAVLSLANTVGTGYMNYRRAKADASLDFEKEMWELERTAIEQFNGLRRELFDTAWRLSASHNFPDCLRLTERQIKQYNNILMDDDLLRKYARLDSIKENFIAYPPFWYYFGNTANSIACSQLDISDSTRALYKEKAKEHFMQYRESNQQGLLREDPISASCALELVDLLDFNNDRENIIELLNEAVKFSGKSNDVMQLAALSFLKLNDYEDAANILNQLVNEQYNTTLNAQILSSLLVSSYMYTKSLEAKGSYEILSNQVGIQYLYPMPKDENTTSYELNAQFINMQREVLRKKYMFVLKAFSDKYNKRFTDIIPSIEDFSSHIEIPFMHKKVVDKNYQLSKVFNNARKTEEYIEILKDAEIDLSIMDLLNDLFDSCSALEFVTSSVKERLAIDIEVAIRCNRQKLNDLLDKVNNNTLNYFDMQHLLEIKLSLFTSEFLQTLKDEIEKYISSRTEMQDFTNAEQNLIEFCIKEELPDPSLAFDQSSYNLISSDEIAQKKRFSIDLLKESSQDPIENLNKPQCMLEIINKYKNDIILSEENASFFTRDNPKTERYFSNSSKLNDKNSLMTDTLAILDNKTLKNDYDLIFTTYGIVSIKNGSVKKAVPYSKVSLQTGKTTYLNIDGHYENEFVNIENLYNLISELKKHEDEIPSNLQGFTFPDIKLPFNK